MGDGTGIFIQSIFAFPTNITDESICHAWQNERSDPPFCLVVYDGAHSHLFQGTTTAKKKNTITFRELILTKFSCPFLLDMMSKLLTTQGKTFLFHLLRSVWRNRKHRVQQANQAALQLHASIVCFWVEICCWWWELCCCYCRRRAIQTLTGVLPHRETITITVLINITDFVESKVCLIDSWPIMPMWVISAICHPGIEQSFGREVPH